MCEDRSRTNGNLAVDHVTAQLVLPCLLLEIDVLLVELVARGDVLGGTSFSSTLLILVIVDYLTSFLVEQQGHFLTRVPYGVSVGDLREDLCHDNRSTLRPILAFFLFSGHMHIDCALKPRIRDDIALHDDEVLPKLHIRLFIDLAESRCHARRLVKLKCRDLQPA